MTTATILDSIERIGTLVLKLVLSIVLLLTAHHYFELEFAGPRNPWILGATAALAAVGLLSAPYAGDWFMAGIKRAGEAVRYGRRVSQGEITKEIELPPPEPKP